MDARVYFFFIFGLPKDLRSGQSYESIHLTYTFSPILPFQVYLYILHDVATKKIKSSWEKSAVCSYIITNEIQHTAEV